MLLIFRLEYSIVHSLQLVCGGICSPQTVKSTKGTMDAFLSHLIELFYFIKSGFSFSLCVLYIILIVLTSLHMTWVIEPCESQETIIFSVSLGAILASKTSCERSDLIQLYVLSRVKKTWHSGNQIQQFVFEIMQHLVEVISKTLSINMKPK